jgi:hypothetical protein
LTTLSTTASLGGGSEDELKAGRKFVLIRAFSLVGCRVWPLGYCDVGDGSFWCDND